MIDPKGGFVDVPAYPIRAFIWALNPEQTRSLSGEHYGVAFGNPGFETKIASIQDIRDRMTAFML